MIGESVHLTAALGLLKERKEELGIELLAVKQVQHDLFQKSLS